MAEDKYIIYLGLGQADELLQVEDRRFLSLYEGFMVPTLNTQQDGPIYIINHSYQCCCYFLPRLNEQYQADLSAAKGLPVHPDTDPAPHVSKGIPHALIHFAEQHPKKYIKP